jgi:hypothetical protein
MTIWSGFFLSKAGATVFFLANFTSTTWVAAVGVSVVGLMLIREDGRCEEYRMKYFMGYCKQIRTRTLILPSAIPFDTDWLRSRPNAVSVMILSICPTPLGKLPVNDSRAVLECYQVWRWICSRYRATGLLRQPCGNDRSKLAIRRTIALFHFESYVCYGKSRKRRVRSQRDPSYAYKKANALFFHQSFPKFSFSIFLDDRTSNASCNAHLHFVLPHSVWLRMHIGPTQSA